MTLMSDGLTAVHAMLDTHASIAITYTSGAYSVTLDAVPGERRKEQSGDVVGQDVTRWSWYVYASELILNGSEVLPQREATITYTNGDRTETYAVFGDDIEPPWEYEDDTTRERLLIRGVLRTVA